MSNILEVRDKIQRWLLAEEEINDIKLTNSGYRISFPHSQCIISVNQAGSEEDGFIHVRIESLILNSFEVTTEFLEFFAMESNGYRLGHFVLDHIKSEDEEDFYALSFLYSLVGDTIDPIEFKHAFYSVVFTAEQKAEEIQHRFGGSFY